MKLKVTVATGEQHNQNKKRFQVLAVYYPGEVVPSKMEYWLGKEGAAFAKGEYVLDLAQPGALKPDAQNFNGPRLDFRHLQPAPGVAKPAM